MAISSSTSGMYTAFGLSIQSELPCPGLPPSSRPADVVVRYGAVPVRLGDAVDQGVCYQVAPGRALIMLDGVARFLVRDGWEIVIERSVEADDASIRLLLLGLCFGILQHQRGRLVLHASAVARDGRCIALAGASSAGKSTLAAAFLQRGYTLVTDEVCAIELGHDGAPVVIPGCPALLLWRNALDRLGLTGEAIERARPGIEKYIWPVAGRFSDNPVRLSHLYVLGGWNQEDIEMVPLHGFARFTTILDQAFRETYLNGLGLASQLQRRCAAVVPRVQTRRLCSPQRWNDLDNIIDRIERDAFASAPAEVA